MNNNVSIFYKYGQKSIVMHEVYFNVTLSTVQLHTVEL
jgi:hypothetical protein